jgi:excisionase family DNA binding protein
MGSRIYSTGEAAKRVGISRATLQAWIANGKIDAPETKSLGNVTVRLWTQFDLARLRKMKQKIYWKGQGRPKKKKRRSKRDAPVLEHRTRP